MPLRLLPPGGASDRVAIASTATDAVTVAREAAVDAALALHSANRVASRHLPTAERRAARRTSSENCMAAIDEAYIAARASRVAPPAPPAPVEPMRSAGELRFKHEFTVRLPGYAEPVKAVADLRVHLGVPEVDRVAILPPSTTWVTLTPRSDAFRRALREIRGPEAGAIRKRAFELMTADADLVEVIPCRFPSDAARGEARS